MTESFITNVIRTILTSSIGATVFGLSRQFSPSQPESWAEVKNVPLTLPHLSPEFDGYRLVQISDFHIGTWINRRRLSEAIHLVNAQRPDLVAMTGDFVTYKPELFASDLVDVLSKISARDGSVAVLGNHDHWTDPDQVRQILAGAGVIDLSNSVFTIQRGAARLHIAGVDDFMDEKDRLDLVLAELPPEGAAILLAHEPDFADISAPTRRFDLQISGHTHGGQIQIPPFGAPYLPRFGRKYYAGLYRVGEMVQYTNRGLGTAEMPIRLNCRPEITVFTLNSPPRNGKPIADPGLA